MTSRYRQCRISRPIATTLLYNFSRTHIRVVYIRKEILGSESGPKKYLVQGANIQFGGGVKGVVGGPN